MRNRDEIQRAKKLDVLRHERPRKSIKRGSVRSCFFPFSNENFFPKSSYKYIYIYIFIYIYISLILRLPLSHSWQTPKKTQARGNVTRFAAHVYTQPHPFHSSQNERQFSCLSRDILLLRLGQQSAKKTKFVRLSIFFLSLFLLPLLSLFLLPLLISPRL